jgi:hypothetical protein
MTTQEQVEQQVSMLSIEQILGWSMLAFHVEARKLVQKGELTKEEIHEQLIAKFK